MVRTNVIEIMTIWQYGSTESNDSKKHSVCNNTETYCLIFTKCRPGRFVGMQSKGFKKWSCNFLKKTIIRLEYFIRKTFSLYWPCEKMVKFWKNQEEWLKLNIYRNIVSKVHLLHQTSTFNICILLRKFKFTIRQGSLPICT